MTFACMAPAVLSTILNYPDKAKHTITTRPRFTVAGAPPPAAFIERLETELGWEFIADLRAHRDGADPHRLDARLHDTDGRRLRSAARAPASRRSASTSRCSTTTGKPVPKDDESIGEVCARSNVVLKGYWEQPEETDEGDLRRLLPHAATSAVWDEFGNIHIVDRKKDVIISGGENISSPEIEDALYKHPAVLECAVIGVPSEKWGETPKALIVLREGTTATEEEIIDVQPRAPGALQVPDLGRLRRVAAADGDRASCRSSSSASSTGSGRAPRPLSASEAARSKMFAYKR